MKYDLAAEIERTKMEFRRRWRLKWQEAYCAEHEIYTYETAPYGGTRKILDVDRAPEPPWGKYHDPEFVGVQWETGFAVITADAFAKMTQTQINKLIGGKQREKRKNVRQRQYPVN